MTLCTRRDFVAAGVAACFATIGPIHRTLMAAADSGGKIDVGPLADFKADGAVDTWAGQHRFFVVRQGGRLFAVSALCTHQNKPLRAENDKHRLFCPQHKSVFALDGTLQEGKAKRSLTHLGVALDDRKHVIVDPATTFEQDQWGKPGSSIAIA